MILSRNKIGILGGVSWHSTMIYYQTLQKLYHQQKAASHSLPLLINSLNLQQVLDGFKQRKLLIQDLQRELNVFAQHNCNPILIASHTMHVLFQHYQQAYPQLNFIHIADAVGTYCVSKHINTVGLLGTRFTMQQSFYQQRLQQNYNITVKVLPHAISHIHHIITEELVHGIIKTQSKNYVEQCITKLVQQGCQTVILGCTELPMLFTKAATPQNVQPHILDPIPLHCEYALATFEGL